MVIEKQGRGRPSRAYVLRQVDLAMGDLARAGGLPTPEEGREIWRGIRLDDAHHSTAIEGNTLVAREVTALLASGRPSSARDLCDHLEVVGYARAAEWVYAQARDATGWDAGVPVTLAEIREIHRLTIGLAWEVCPPADPPLVPGEGPGGWRRHDIAAFPDGMRPPPWTEVPAAMHDWVARAATGPAPGEHPIVFLAALHGTFERIHPFRDGNGRVGRLLLSLLLVRHGYPPAIIRTGMRGRYLGALRSSDRGSDLALAEVIARAVKEGIDRFLLPNLAGPVKLVPLSALVRPGLGLPALRAAAAKGTLRSTRDPNGRRLSTTRWVDEYLATRRLGRPRTR